MRSAVGSNSHLIQVIKQIIKGHRLFISIEIDWLLLIDYAWLVMGRMNDSDLDEHTRSKINRR